MDAMVTARVPQEIKEQGNALLKSIGSTPTELVNAAYSYVIKEHALPIAHVSQESTSENSRILSAQQKEKIRAALSSMRLNIDKETNISFKEQLNEARDERFAAIP